MDSSFEESWIESLAWRKKCNPKAFPPPEPVRQVYEAIRQVFARRDRAHDEIERLSSLGLSEDAEASLEAKGGWEWLLQKMDEAGCRVRPNYTDRKIWSELEKEMGWETWQDPTEKLLREREGQGDEVAGALLEMYAYEELKDYYVAFETMCKLLEVDPNSEATWDLFHFWCAWKVSWIMHP